MSQKIMDDKLATEDFLYKLRQVDEASQEETDEIMKYLESLSEDELEYITEVELNI